MIPRRRTAIAGEVGPTHVRFALIDMDELRLDHFVNFRCGDFTSIEQALASYLRSLPAHPDVLSLAVAGTVDNDRASVLGSGWHFTRRHLESAMSMRHVTLIRDISAMALALPLLEPHEIEQVGGEAPFIDRPKIVMSFGHFLEAATIIPVDDGWMALAGAAGEMSLGGVDAEEIELLKHAGADGPMSAGNLLSSEALQRLYVHLLSRKGRVADGDPHDSLATGLAKQDAVAVEASQIFSAWIGRRIGDLALLTGAEGGAYLVSDEGRYGLDVLSPQALRQGFEAGRTGSGLARLPLFLARSTTAVLRGAALAIQFDEDHGGGQPAA
ncbi:MAG: glucokinase [Pseudomonadota bacterium]|nr:glucokinase [Pseudomonadota bacterium]